MLTMLFSAIAGVSAFAFASAVTQSSRRKDQVWFLSILLATLFIHAIGELFIVSDSYRIVPHLAGAEVPIRVALGPLLFFYVRSMVSPEPLRFGGRDWLSVLGPVLALLISLPFLLLSADQKLALVNPETRDPLHYRMALAACAGGMLIFLSFTMAYLFAALRLQTRHLIAMKTQRANVESLSLDWLRKILIFWSIAWLVYAINELLLLGGVASTPLTICLAMTEALSIAVFAHLALRQRSVPADTHVKSESVPRVPILSEGRMARTAKKLVAALNSDRLFADGDLSLRDLSDATGITRNHISETLSQNLGMNFFDFVNLHRIQEAKRLLRESDLSVLAIAMQVGFNSRSTFNTAFKKHTGTTPTAYRSNADGGAGNLHKAIVCPPLKASE